MKVDKDTLVFKASLRQNKGDSRGHKQGRQAVLYNGPALTTIFFVVATT